MSIDSLFWLYLGGGGAVGLLLLYVVIRAAVISGMKAVEVWKAKGGAQSVLDAETFARTGIRPPPQ